MTDATIEYIEATIQGERYIGQFKARRYQILINRSTPQYTVETIDYWYQGIGIIKEDGKRTKLTFLLETEKVDINYDPNQQNSLNPLERNIIRIVNPEKLEVMVSREKYPLVADIVLKDMFNQVKTRDALAAVIPIRLNMGALQSLGYCMPRNRQLLLDF